MRSSMQDKIRDIIKQYPKHFSVKIQKNPEMHDWVVKNSLITDCLFIEMLYSALYQKSNICRNGNIMKMSRFNSGFAGCGPSAKCQCTRETISQNVSATKKKYTIDQHIETNNKRTATMLAKYGVLFNSQRSDIKHIWQKPKISEDAAAKLSDFSWLDNEYNVKSRTLVDIANELNVYYSTVGEYCRKFNFTIRQRTNYSLIENEIVTYISSLGVSCVQSDWTTLTTHELDILIPSKNLAIEVNGLYWHSYHPSANKVENKNRHLDKTKLALQNGVDLIHITDYEWNNHQDIVKSVIRSKLGLNTTVYARNCTIRLLDKKIEKQFISKYHIHGYIPSKFSVGLFYQDQLQSVMSFVKSRFSTKHKYELARFCTVGNVTVVGGGSKMIKFAKSHIDNESIVSYCDYSKSSGNGYTSMGFLLCGQSGPGYFWTDGTNIVSRYKSQKSQLKKWLLTYDPLLSESSNMFAANYRRYYDCGNLIFEI